MTEAVFVNLALTVRVLIVGGVLLILPRITRKGLLFGAYIGESVADQGPARRLVSGWRLGCAILMTLSLVVGYGISLAGRPVTGNFTGTAFLLLGALGLYLRFHMRARELAPPAAARQAEKAVASLIGGKARGAGLAKVALVFCIVASVATFVYALASYEAAPRQNAFTAVMLTPGLNMVLTPFLALLALLTTGAKHSLRGGSGGNSVAAQRAFRDTMTRMLSWTAILICALMSVLSVHVVGFVLFEAGPPGVGFWALAVITLAFIAGNLVRIMKRYGQGGALRESGSVEAPLTNGLADNTRWWMGMFYVDRNDPSLMVEKRFGVGYSLNYGNPTAILILGTFLVLTLAVTAFILLGPKI